MRIKPIDKLCYQTYPIDGVDGVIEITDEQFAGVKNGTLCFNEDLTAVIKRVKTAEEITAETAEKAQERENERITEYRWVDDQISKSEREKLLAGADIIAIEAKIAALRQYANAVWATQQQADYPQSVTYPNRPTI